MPNQFVAKSRRLRSTIYSSRIEKQGVTSYTIYNHMLLPAGFEGSLEETYNHLKNYVQIWDVAAERQIEIKGKDAYQLVQLMTCRDLSKAKEGKCYYCPIIDENGGMINDPVVLKFNNEKWWISIADSDVMLFAKGLAIGKNFEVSITEPDVNIMAVQGPKAFDLLEKVFGKEILELKFYNFKYFNFKNTKHLIARSGWSKQGGVEIYVEDTKSGLELYDLLFEEGKELKVKPGCPHLIERIEGALLSYGNDMDINDNPFECGLDKFVNLENDIKFLGKENLTKIKENGINKKLMGVKINLDKINLRSAIHLTIGDKIIGEIRSAVFSPTFNMVIGIAMINKPYFLTKDQFDIIIENKKYKGEICDIPFV